MKMTFRASKHALRDLLFLRVQDEIRRDNERPSRADFKAPAIEPNTETGSMWDHAVAHAESLRDSYDTADLAELRRRAATLLRTLRRTCARSLLRYGKDTYQSKALRTLAYGALASRDRRTMVYVKLELDEIQRWELDHRDERVDRSALAEEQRRYNAKQETLRHWQDEAVLIDEDYEIAVPDPSIFDNPKGTTLTTLRTHSTTFKSALTTLPSIQAGVKSGDGRQLVAAGNSPTKSVDIRGFHRAAPPAKKLKRWAFCAHCTTLHQASDPEASEVWFLTAAERGTARHGTCRKREGAPPERTSSPLQWVVRHHSRLGNPVVMIYLLTRSRRGWVMTSVSRYNHEGVQEMCDRPMSLVPVAQDVAIRQLRRRKAQQYAAKRQLQQA